MDVRTVKIGNKLSASFFHFFVSLALVGGVALLVFFIWHPYPYSKLTGGANLFLVLVCVDVTCGPILTAIVYSPKKTKAQLIFDLSVVLTVQIAALSYGLYAVAESRPVVLVFEVDRLVVVAAADIEKTELVDAPPRLRKLSWIGPRLIGIREPSDNDEMLRALTLSLQGIEPSARPGWWKELSPNREELREKMKPISLLLKERRSWELKNLIKDISRGNDLKVEDIYYLPLTGRRSRDWIVVLNRRAEFLGFAPVDGFLAAPKK